MKRLIYDNRMRYRVSRHLIFFSLTVLLFTFISFVQGNDERDLLNKFRITFVNALFFFGYAYITIFILVPEFLLRKRFFLFVILFLIVGIGLSTIKLISSGHIFYADISPENIEKTGFVNLRYILVNTKDMSFIVALFCIIKYAKDYLYTQQQLKQLASKYKEAQNRMLQSQFNPHFLFNTMNNLYSLSLSDIEKTREVIERFRKVMSYLVEESQKQYVGLEEEINLVENFINLQSLRYGDRLSIEFSKPDNTEGYLVPSMIVFFLIENCFRHGSSIDAGNPWIKLELWINNGRININTRNSKPAGSFLSYKNGKKGSFFRNLTKRLSILFGEEGYSLRISDQPEFFEVNLELSAITGEN